MRDDPQSYLELAVDYLRCGMYVEARDVLQRLEQGKKDTHPLVLYYLGYLEQKAGGEDGAARRFFERAALSSPGRCFPFRRETAAVLESVLEENPGDSRACYYLGTCLFEIQPEKAIEYWERSRELGEEYFMLFRNLGLAYARVRNDGEKAVSLLEEALERERGQARLFFEMDLMSEAAGESPEKRLALLENNHATVKKRDDALTQEIKLLVQTGRYGRAIELMSGHHFHVWEGGGQIHSYFVHAHLLRGLSSYKKGDYERALRDFTQAGEYPLNLEVGEPYHGGRGVRLRYFEGTALEALGRMDEAAEAYADSAARETGWSELSFYRGMALSRLGRAEEAADVFQGLSVFAGRRLDEAPAVDFFTKFGERQSAAARRARSFYLLGLAELGLGDKAAARNALELAVSEDSGLFWARYYLGTLR
jgi:tetratricopeptide (TPR) repeat protein